MKEGFKLKSFNNYNLTLEEQKELVKFLGKNLEKGYIQPFQSSMVSLFFFIKRRMENCNHVKLIGIQMYSNDWKHISTASNLRNHGQTERGEIFDACWAEIMFKSDLVTNESYIENNSRTIQTSSHFFLKCAILQQPSRQ